MSMKKVMLGIACLLVAGAALAETMTLTGTLKILADGKYYSLEGCTPELATTFKGEQFSSLNMEQFASGDQVKIVLDVTRIRSDGKISPGSATIISVEKVQ